ncbi:MAG TPA: hypothetical protein VGL93_10355 [Streptosporangiaceae bacterium]
MRSDLDLIARSILTGGGVCVYVAQLDGEHARPALVSAAVQGANGLHAVDLRYGGWRCTCVGWVQQHDGLGDCPHIRAVQLATGHAPARTPAGVTRW